MAAGFPWTKGITSDDKLTNLNLIRGSDSASRIDNAIRRLAADGAKALDVLVKGDVVLQSNIDELIDLSVLNALIDKVNDDFDDSLDVSAIIVANTPLINALKTRINALEALEG